MTTFPPKSLDFFERVIVRNPIVIFMQTVKAPKDTVMMTIIGNFYLLSLSREELINWSV
jgi:hypothetical protein